MGSRVTSPDGLVPTGENDENNESDEQTAELSDFDGNQSPLKLGDVLSGRLADVDIDSVEAVRETRARR